MQIQVKQLFIRAVLALFVMIGWVTWKRHPAAPEIPGAPVQAAPRATAIPASPPAPQPGARAIPASVANNTATLDVTVASLLGSQDPAGAYAAYFLVSSCTMFNRHHDLKLYDPTLQATRDMTASERQNLTRFCSGMTERERIARLDYLSVAVKGGITGAALTFAQERPFGDPSALKSRPDDPLVREWKTTATTQLSKAAEAGDMAVRLSWGMQLLSDSELAPKNPVLGYDYLLAYGFIQSDRVGPNDTGAQTFRDGSTLMNALVGHFTLDQRAAAVAAGRAIADRVKRRG